MKKWITYGLMIGLSLGVGALGGLANLRRYVKCPHRADQLSTARPKQKRLPRGEAAFGLLSGFSKEVNRNSKITNIRETRLFMFYSGLPGKIFNLNTNYFILFT